MSTEKTKNLSRRGFLAGAAIAGLGTLAACSTGADGAAAGSGGTLPGVPEKWDQEADIVIIGIGCAGIAAAVEASNQGATSIILEKMPEDTAGGDSTCFGGAFSVYQAEMLMYFSLGSLSPDGAALRAAASEEMLGLVSGWGVKLNEMGMVEGGATEFYQRIKDGLAATNPTILYETPATGLIKNPATNEIVGVKATQAGAEITLKANKAVIVAAGDYSANPQMMSDIHWPALPIVATGSPANVGDGLKICTEVGASIHSIPKGLEWNEFALRKASEELGTGVIMRWYNTVDFMMGQDSSPLNGSQIFVNIEGKRFMNEKQILSHEKSQLAFTDFAGNLFEPDKRYTNLPGFMVCDDAQVKSYSLVETPGDAPSTWAWTHSGYTWSADNSAEIEKGWIIKADTIEELASKMTANHYLTGMPLIVDAAALQATIDEYNAGCAAGVDAFGREPGKLKPISTPPFYASEIVPSALYTIGGVITNENGETLDWNDQPISRLYAAGNVGQGMVLGPYGVCGCMGMGTLAVRHAVTLEPWA
jgi:succinate dehydrogenase/fumarate reductase flavoprotein subunit